MPRTTIDINVFNLPRLKQELERQEAQIVQLTQERDFWENEYEEVIACLDGQDPRR